MHKISDIVERKFVESIDLSEWEIDTDSGWRDISAIHKTVEYDVWEIITENGLELLCADNHIVFEDNYNEIFVKDCKVNETKILTRFGPSVVKSVKKLDIPAENMYDVSVESPDHRFWSNNILSHNSTVTCGFILWFILFHPQKTVALLANKGETAQEILGKIQLAYQHLPKWLQQGVVEWNKRSFILENNSRVIATATSSDNIRGFAVNLVFIDEAAFIENWDEFFTSVYPTVSSGESTKIVLVSTPNGLNHFYHTWANAVDKKNNYNPIFVPWQKVPGRNEEWRAETLKALNFDQQKFDREYNCEFQGSSGTLIAGWKLKQMMAIEPIVEREGLCEYEKPQEGHSYVCVVDVSRGKGLDYSAFSVIDVSKMPYVQVCTYRNNLVAPIDYAEVVFRVAKSYNNAQTLVEINDLGEQISNSIHYDFEYDNLLFTESAGRNGKRISGGFGNNIDRGIRTTKIVKSIGCSILKLLLEQNQLIIHDKNTISELTTFSKKGVSYEAESGKHDDMVMSLVLFAWLSDQTYFKDITDINTLAKLREKTEEDIFSDLLPFGFVDDGSPPPEVIDLTTPLGNWFFSVEDDNL